MTEFISSFKELNIELFIKTAQSFTEVCQSLKNAPLDSVVSLDSLLLTLPHLSKERGYIYEALTPLFDTITEKYYVYAHSEKCPSLLEYKNGIRARDRIIHSIPLSSGDREEASKLDEMYRTYYPISKKVRTCFSPISVWEWVLLNDLPLLLARDTVKEFYLHKYVFQWQDLLELAYPLSSYVSKTGGIDPNYESRIMCSGLPKDTPFGKLSPFTRFPSRMSIRSAILFIKDNPSMIPSVGIIDESTIDITYYSWCGWGGLTKNTYRAKSARGGKIKLNKIEEKTIFEYYFKTGYCPWGKQPPFKLFLDDPDDY